MKYLPRDVAFAKLEAIVAGAATVRSERYNRFQNARRREAQGAVVVARIERRAERRRGRKRRRAPHAAWDAATAAANQPEQTVILKQVLRRPPGDQISVMTPSPPTGFASASSSVSGSPPPSKSLFPFPSTVGNTISRYSSTR